MLKQLAKGSVAVCAAAFLLAGCAQGHKQHHGLLYHGADGHYYTRSYDDSTSQFIYWMWMTNAMSSSNSANSFAANSGSWERLPTMPQTPLTSTSKVVTEEDGKPSEDVENETTASQQDEVTETTTESQAQSSATEAPESDLTPSGVESEGSGDSGAAPADSGSSGGDGGGGGDSGPGL